jgi:hypothetical protein
MAELRTDKLIGWRQATTVPKQDNTHPDGEPSRIG